LDVAHWVTNIAFDTTQILYNIKDSEGTLTNMICRYSSKHNSVTWIGWKVGQRGT